MDGVQLSRDFQTTMRRQFISNHELLRNSWSHFIDITRMKELDHGRMKSWVELGATQWLWTRENPGLGMLRKYMRIAIARYVRANKQTIKYTNSPEFMGPCNARVQRIQRFNKPLEKDVFSIRKNNLTPPIFLHNQQWHSINCILVMSRTRFRVNPHSIVAWMSRNSLLEAGAKSEG